jgi:hypothetical protein
VSTDPHAPAVTRPWTLVGAGGALAALALVVAAAVDIAVEGTPYSWPQLATLLAGLRGDVSRALEL